MSKIDTLIQELQVKKSKIDYLTYIKDMLETDPHCVDYKMIKDEVLKMLMPKIDDLILAIEDGTNIENSESLSSSEVKVLKTIVNRVNAKPIETSIQKTGPQLVAGYDPVAPKKPQELDAQTKMAFALANRDLASKTATAPDGFTGTIVGLDAPNIIVQDSSGFRRKFQRSDLAVTE